PLSRRGRHSVKELDKRVRAILQRREQVLPDGRTKPRNRSANVTERTPHRVTRPRSRATEPLLHGRSEVRKRNFALPHKLAIVRNRHAQMTRDKLERRKATGSQTVTLLRLQRDVSGDLIKDRPHLGHVVTGNGGSVRTSFKGPL